MYEQNPISNWNHSKSSLYNYNIHGLTVYFHQFTITFSIQVSCRMKQKKKLIWKISIKQNYAFISWTAFTSLIFRESPIWPDIQNTRFLHALGSRWRGNNLSFPIYVLPISPASPRNGVDLNNEVQSYHLCNQKKYQATKILTLSWKTETILSTLVTLISSHEVFTPSA